MCDRTKDIDGDEPVDRVVRTVRGGDNPSIDVLLWCASGSDGGSCDDGSCDDGSSDDGSSDDDDEDDDGSDVCGDNTVTLDVSRLAHVDALSPEVETA